MEKTFTLKELAHYNGQDGAPAYIAVDGVVYDVSQRSAWKNGQHHGYKAGNDFSEQIKRAPHEKSVLPRLPKVGKLIN
ncbi:cytochrome b5 domain-containing protein [Ligilactobacillus apodemi]|uniref:cytochrome b5 domain-containing protein n=1 Tax=Ligilactobacillus apodemi TaxID=307126 RepID=UPI000468B634|nr:cytochrome b5 domain-containing protein [Ligilactobacillus apodemi]MCR1902087.1 cytochrome B5 [Ligilactobacillus apodemi]